MKKLIKSALFITGMVVMASNLHAQEKKTKIIIKENRNGQETITESDELTPELKEKLKNDGIEITDLEPNGSGSEKKIIINKEIDSKDGDGKMEKVIIRSGDMNDPELKKMMQENNVQVIEENGHTKVMVDGKEISSSDSKDHKHKIVKIEIKKINLTDPSSEEYKKAGITEPKEKLEIHQMQASPNPSNGKFRVSFTSTEKSAATLNIKNIEGKDIYTEQIKDFNGSYDKEIDLLSKDKGVYFVTVTQGTRCTTKKLVVE